MKEDKAISTLSLEERLSKVEQELVEVHEALICEFDIIDSLQAFALSTIKTLFDLLNQDMSEDNIRNYGRLLGIDDKIIENLIRSGMLKGIVSSSDKNGPTVH